MKYVAWLPIDGYLKVEIKSDHELKSSELRRRIMDYLDEEKNPTLGICETLKDISTDLEPRSIKINLLEGDAPKVSQIKSAG